MIFNAHKPIYLQICDQINERILNGDLKAGDRVLSVRELGMELGVNPNTTMRSYEYLQNKGIIYNKRGIGYYVADNAMELVLNSMRKDFIDNELPVVFKKMDLLGIGMDDLVGMYGRKKD